MEYQNFYNTGYGQNTGNSNPTGGKVPLNIFGAAGVRNAHMWFVAIVPYIAVALLERYAQNRTQGIILWVCVYVISVAVCLWDAKLLRGAGYDTGTMLGFSFLPPVYILMRKKLLRQSAMLFITCLIAVFLAFFGSQFTQYAMADAGDFVDYLNQSSVSRLEQFQDDTYQYRSVQTALDEYYGTDNYTYSYTKEKGDIFVNYVSTAHSANTTDEIVILLNEDGFTVTEMRIESITRNGVELTGDAFDTAAREIFMKETATSESSSQQDQIGTGDVQEV